MTLALGVIAGQYFLIQPYILFIFTITLLLISCVFFFGRKTHFNQTLLLFTIFFVGMILIQSQNIFSRQHISRYITGDKSIVRGFVLKSPEQKFNRTRLVLKFLSIIDGKAKPASGKIIVYLYNCSKDTFQYGDEIIVQGRLSKPSGKRNPGGFDFRAFLDRKGIHGILRVKQDHFRKTSAQFGNVFLRKIVYPARRYCLKTIGKTSTGSSQHLLKALLVGERTEMPVHLYEQFSKAGIAHVLAVSGLHVGFILMMLWGVFTLLRIPYPLRVVLVISGLGFFTLLTESRPPVVRAFIMAAFYLIGTLFERKPKPLNIIGLAALFSLCINPKSLFDLGFQLSYTAVLAIVIGYRQLRILPIIKVLYEKTVKIRFLHYFLTMGLVSFLAQLGTLPITAFYFNRISLMSIPLNIIAIPLTGLTVTIGFATLLLNLLHPHFISILGPFNNLILAFIISLARWTSSLDFSHFTCPTPNILHIALYFSMLILFTQWRFLFWRKRFIFLILILGNIILFKNIIFHPKPKLELVQFDVGYGDAALLKLPWDHHILIDGGSRNPTFDNGESVIAPYLRQKGIRHLDAVFLSHPHNDHIGGLIYILNHFHVHQLFVSDTLHHSPLFDNLIQVALEKGISFHEMSDSDTLQFPGVRLFCLSAGEVCSPVQSSEDMNLNNTSLVLKICFGKTSFIFMGDAEKSVEKTLLQSDKNLKSTVLKIAHHGSVTSSMTCFLKRIQPEHAIISVGRHNKWGHPSQKVIQRLENLEIQTHRTDKDGAIVMRSDGENIRIVNWKNGVFNF